MSVIGTVCFVDSPASAAAASAALPNARFVTDNPFLSQRFHHVEQNISIENIDALLSQEETNTLGEAALQLAVEVDRHIADPAIARHYQLMPDAVVISPMSSRAIASLFHRSALLARALEEYRPAKFMNWVINTPRCEPGNPFSLPRFAAPGRSLAEFGFFEPCSVETTVVPYPLPETVNDTRSHGFGRRVALLPLSYILFEAVSRVLPLPSWRGAIAVGQENESVREVFPWLALKGVGLKRVGNIAITSKRVDISFEQDFTADAILREKLFECLRSGAKSTRFFSVAQSDAIAELLLRHFSAGMNFLSSQLPDAVKRVDALKQAGVRHLISNSLLSPIGYQILKLCRARSISVIELEHGVTAGIAALADYKYDYLYLPPADVFLACSETAAQAVRGNEPEDELDVKSIGLPKQTRRLLHAPLQRRLARRALKLSADETVVMYVSTMLQHGNKRPGLKAASETTSFEIERTLLTETFADLPHKVVFKRYPTQRMPYDPGYDALFSVPGNVQFASDEDLRYLRAAADLIVTSTPTSSLGWCLGTGVPLIWLDSKSINPVSNERIRKAFAEAFLFVDQDEPDWSQTLRRLLQQDLAVIQTAWREKSDARAQVWETVIAGRREQSGRLTARLLTSMLSSNSSQCQDLT